MKLTAVAAVALVAAVWALLHVGWLGSGQIVDYAVYQDYGTRIVHLHQVPYRDFRPEYPPAAMPLFAFPALFRSSRYDTIFQLLTAACAAAAALGALLAGGRRAALLTAVAPLALGSVVLSRFDFWPAALTVLALAATLRRRPVLSGVLLGTAFAAKLWPALLAPLLVVWLLRREGRQVALRFAAAAVATASAWFLPFLALAPRGVAHSFYLQLARPLQIESLGAAVLLVAHHVADTSLGMVGSFGSQNLAGPGVHAAAVATTIAGALALVGVYVAFLRSRGSRDDLVRCSAAGVAVVIGFGKVLSPQFLIWLVPLVPLVRGARARVAVPMLFAALLLTQAYFPHDYWQLALEFRRLTAVEVLVRDLLVVGIAAVLAWPSLQHEVLGEHRARIEALERVRAQVD